MLGEAFSCDFELVYQNGEIQDYLLLIRSPASDATVFSNVDALANDLNIAATPLSRNCTPDLSAGAKPASAGKSS